MRMCIMSATSLHESAAFSMPWSISLRRNTARGSMSENRISFLVTKYRSSSTCSSLSTSRECFSAMINVSEGGRHSINGRMRIYRIFRNVSHYLDDTFIAFNGDVVCSVDLNDMYRPTLSSLTSA